MPSIVFGGKIRSVHPDCLPPASDDSCASDEVTPEPRARQGHKPRSKTAPVMREDVMDVRYSQFPDLPVELWNHLTSALRDSLKAFCKSMSEAYKAGIDDVLSRLVDKTIPELVQSLGRDVMSGLLLKERGFHGTYLRCHECPETAVYNSDVHKGLVTSLGLIDTGRSYYVCPGGHTFYPQDILLGVDGEHRILPSVQENISLLTSHVAYRRAVELLERISKTKLSEDTVMRVTATTASLVEAEQEAERRRAFDLEHPIYPESTESTTISPEEVGVVGADGGFLKIRGEKEEREFKLGVLGTIVPKPGEIPMRTESGHRVKRELAPTKGKTYLAHIENIDDFSEHLTVEFYRRGLHNCSLLHFIADGADHFWSRFEALVQPHQEVSRCLDLPHAMEHIGEAARAIFDGNGRPSGTVSQPLMTFTDLGETGSDNTESSPKHALPPSASESKNRSQKYQRPPKPEENTRKRAWYDAMEDRLIEGRLDDFFEELERQREALSFCKERAEVLESKIGYFTERRRLLRYRKCLERGLPIGTGMVEGGVRFIGKDRLHRSGMKWNRDGAEAILQLRCLDASKRWDPFFKKASAKRLARYNELKTAWRQVA